MQLEHQERARASSPSQAAEFGSFQPRYQIRDELARGGMGSVFKAYDRVRRRHVALKRPRDDVPSALRSRFVAMMASEYRTLLSIRHPRVVGVYDYGFDDVGPYYTMELLDGADLQVMSPLPWRQLCSYLRDIASSLALLHARRLVHRDVSPLNIRVTGEGCAKLLDFGALAPFGSSSEVVGAAMTMAPEALQRGELDQRLDIFALGATAYYALTGRAAYPASSVHQLPVLWRESTPTPISELVDGVPPELDALVMSMLRLDRMARPNTVAEVIDRLNTAAALDPDDDERVLMSYLRSPALVGRAEPRSRVAAELVRAEKGPSCVLLEGAAGLGKSAMLQEVCQDASISGALVLAALGKAHTGDSFSACMALVSQAVFEAGRLMEPALEAAGLSWNEARRAPVRAQPKSDGSLADLTHDDYVRLFSALADQRPLVLALDDADRADAASVLALHALTTSTTARVLAVLTASPDHTGSQVAMRVVRRTAVRVDLPVLTEGQIAELVRSWFGDIAAIRRLASWLTQKSAGSPFLCAEQVADLVRKREVRYVGGGWALPAELPKVGLGLSSIQATRLDGLSHGARSLAICLSAQRTALRRADARAIASVDANLSEAQWEAAVAELERERIILREAEHLVFASDDIRLLLRHELKGEQRSRVHAHLARILGPASTDNAYLRLEVAYHLLAASDEAQANPYLKGALAVGLRHAETLVRMVPDLLDCYAEYERLKVPEDERRLVALPLVVAGMYVDPSQTQDPIGAKLVAHLWRCAGMDVATRFQRWIGAVYGFAVGLICCAWRHARTNKLRRSPTWINVLASFYGCCASLSFAALARSDRGMYAHLLPLLAHAKVLPSTHAARLVHDTLWADVLYTDGRVAESLAEFRRLFATFPKVKDLHPDTEAQWDTAFRFYMGYLLTHAATAEPLTHAERLQQSPVPHNRIHAEFLRFTYHLNRGETVDALSARDRMDALSAVHGGSWMPDLMCASNLAPYHLAGDVVGVKARYEELREIARKTDGLRVARDVARAMYEGHRGRHAQAVSLYEALSPQIAPFSSPVWSLAHGHWAECLNALGRHEEALALVRRALAALHQPDRTFVLLYQQLEREQAIALAGLGQTEEAVTLLDQLLAQQVTSEQPLLTGLLHRDRALVALLCVDQAAFREHAEHTRRMFGATNNPALAALIHKLFARGQQAGLVADAASPEVRVDGPFEVAADEAVTVIAKRTTEYVVHALGASSARLYLLNDHQPALCASSGDDRWPPALADEVLALAASLASIGDSTEVVSEGPENDNVTQREDGLRLYPLQTIDDGEIRAVGILAIANCTKLEDLTPSALHRYTQVVYRALHRSSAALPAPMVS